MTPAPRLVFARHRAASRPLTPSEGQPAGKGWAVFAHIPQVAACLPGAELTELNYVDGHRVFP